jgi:hypothetical protein
MFDEKEFFYCYSTNLFRFLKVEKKINYICCGFHEKTLQKFWQFRRTDELKQAIAEYKQRGIEMGVIKG